MLMLRSARGLGRHIVLWSSCGKGGRRLALCAVVEKTVAEWIRKVDFPGGDDQELGPWGRRAGGYHVERDMCGSLLDPGGRGVHAGTPRGHGDVQDSVFAEGDEPPGKLDAFAGRRRDDRQDVHGVTQPVMSQDVEAP